MNAFDNAFTAFVPTPFKPTLNWNTSSLYFAPVADLVHVGGIENFGDVNDHRHRTTRRESEETIPGIPLAVTAQVYLSRHGCSLSGSGA
jgi:hypothetical protein